MGLLQKRATHVYWVYKFSIFAHSFKITHNKDKTGI